MARANVPHVISDDSALGGQLISGSLRFNSANNTKLSRNFGTNTSDTTKTISFWVKRGTISSSSIQNIFSTTVSGNIEGRLRINTDDTLQLEDRDASGGTSDGRRTTTRTLRDTSSWYHIMLVLDSTESTELDRAKIYINGAQDTNFSATRSISQNYSFSFFRSNAENFIGCMGGTSEFFDGNLTEINFIDGQALDPSYFGYTESQTGIWRPKKYTGTFGNNGFNLPMNGSSHVGRDMSGNGNDFTLIMSGTVPIERATGAFPIMNTNNGATIPIPGFRPDPFASNLVVASTFSDPSDILDVHHLIKGSGSEKGLFVTGTTKDTSQHNFYGRSGSLFFNGNGDKVTVNSTSDFAFGTGDFTIEQWFYKSTTNVNEYLFDFENQLSVFIMAGQVIYYFAQIGGSNTGNVAFGTVEVNQWNHVAIVRQSGVIKLFLNGELKHSQNESRNWSSAQALTIGQYSGGGAYSFEGYMQDFRVYKGAAKYTDEFLCGAVDSSITEHSPSGIAVPRTLDPSIGGSTGFNMEGASVFFSSNSDLALDGDFTIEFWVYLESIQTDGGIHPSVITFPAESSQSIIGQVYINSANKFFGLYNSNSGDICRTPYKSATVGKWQYVTVTRSSNSCRIFIDGKLKQTGTDSTTYGNQLGIMRLGGYSRSNGMVDGHISNLRIIKGTALYTSDFTPPTEPLTNVTGTKLLCFQSPTDVEDVTVNPNSSSVNNQNWLKTGSYSNTEPPSVRAVLDGDGYSFWGQSNGEATFTFPGSGIPFTKLEISGSNYNGHYVKVNGVTFTNWGTTFTNPPYHNVTSVGSPLTSITVKGSGGTTSTMSAIRINDNTIIAPDFANDPYTSDAASASHFSPFDNDIIQKGPSQYATLNPLAMHDVTLSNGNLTNTGGNDISSNMGVKTGKFYAEVSIDNSDSGSNLTHLGVCATGVRSFRANNSNNHIISYLDNVLLRSDNAGPFTSTGRGGITTWNLVTDDTDVGFTIGDTVGIQIDMDNKFVKFFINGVLRVHYTFVLATTFDKMYFYGRNNGSGVTTWNFGQKPYEFTPPSGFLPLASHNLESASILNSKKYFEPALYSNGGGSAVTVDTLQFKPDLIWVKSRNATANHGWYDSVRGNNNRLISDGQNAESSVTGPIPTESGFTIAGTSYYNPSGTAGAATFATWCWKAGGDSNTFNIDGVGYATASAAGLDGGTANPTGASVNTKAGFSIISYTATQNQNVSYSHGLNQAPEIIITKDRDNSRPWGVYYSVDGTNTNWMQLNNSDAQGSNNSGTTPVGGFSGSYMTLHQDYFAPAYSAFANGGNDGNDRIISYMWHSVPGYSKIGMYRGNGNDNGPFIDCGFRPAFIMTKSTSSGSYWWEMVDNKRSPINPSQRTLYANKSDAEYNSSTYNKDIFSNGFKPRSGNGGHNDNAETYLFMAFAEQPEVTPFGSQSNAR